MSTIRAEALACEALRDTLLNALPAKVAAVNLTRAAFLRAATVGPYVVTGNLLFGVTPGSESTAALTTGSRTAAQVASDITAAAISGLTASVDTLGRLLVTATATPSSTANSTVSLGAGAAGVNSVFGWNDGGMLVNRGGIIAPGSTGVVDGWPDGVHDFGPGFWLVLGQRTTEQRSPNTKDDTHVVTVDASLLAADPNSNSAAAMEFIQACLRCVREVTLDNRALDNAAVLKTELSRVVVQPDTFKFDGKNVSGLYLQAQLTFRIAVFERS